MQKWDRLNLAYVGIDIHKRQHTAVVLDCFGDRLGTVELANRAADFPAGLAGVQALAPGKRLVFGLENTSTWGRALAGFLLAQGQTVRDVAPIRTAQRRRRHPHPDKSDARDALYIARALVQDLGELPATAERAYQPERDSLLRHTLAHLRYLDGVIQGAEQRLGELVPLLGQHLETLPGVGVVLAAELLVGIGDVRRFATPDKLARYAGIAPKAWGSAGQSDHTESEHGRRSLHATFFHLAVAQIQLNRDGRPRCPESRAYYEKKLGEGKKKKAALTCLMRVLVRVVWRMLTRREPYTKATSSGAA